MMKMNRKDIREILVGVGAFIVLAFAAQMFFNSCAAKPIDTEPGSYSKSNTEDRVRVKIRNETSVTDTVLECQVEYGVETCYVRVIKRPSK